MQFGILGWILFGLIVGSIANALDSRPSKGGLLGSIILGIVGALVGGFLGSLLLGRDVTGFDIPSILLAIGGSMVLLFVGKALTRSTI